MTWGTEIEDITSNCNYNPHSYEVKKFGFVSGQLWGTVSIVLDEPHPFPGSNGEEEHFNIRWKVNHLVDGTRIPSQEWPQPNELTKEHYKVNEYDKLILELFKNGDFNKFFKNRK